MRIRTSRMLRAIAAVLVGLLMTAGLVGVTEVAPAAAAVVNDQPLSGVASSMWQTNNTVWALDVANNVVYAGGQFTSVRPPGNALGTGEVARNRIAAFNATTGALITTFNPNANGMVYDVDVSPNGQYLYVAGSFTTIGGQTRQRIARLNLPSGTVDTALDARTPTRSSPPSSSDNNNVYVGGDFTTIKDAAPHSASRSSTRPTAMSSPRSTPAPTSGSPRARIAPNGTRLLVGGEIDVVNGAAAGGRSHR